MKHPEFLKEGQRLVFREGRTKAVGNVTKIKPYVPAIVTKDPKKAQGSQMRGDGKKRQQGQVGGAAINQIQQPVQA